MVCAHFGLPSLLHITRAAGGWTRRDGRAETLGPRHGPPTTPISQSGPSVRTKGERQPASALAVRPLIREPALASAGDGPSTQPMALVRARAAGTLIRGPAAGPGTKRPSGKRHRHGTRLMAAPRSTAYAGRAASGTGRRARKRTALRASGVAPTSGWWASHSRSGPTSLNSGRAHDVAELSHLHHVALSFGVRKARSYSPIGEEEALHLDVVHPSEQLWVVGVVGTAVGGGTAHVLVGPAHGRDGLLGLSRAPIGRGRHERRCAL